MNMQVQEYERMTMRDFEIKTEGWAEQRRQDRFVSWEQMRASVLPSIFKLSKTQINRILKNPYEVKVEERGREVSENEWRERIKNWDTLTYKEYKQ